jgi:hypothetical protein
MSKKIRLVLAIVILSLSLYLLAWGYLPNPRETRERIIPPAELQLPAPSSLHFTPEPAS